MGKPGLAAAVPGKERTDHSLVGIDITNCFHVGKTQKNEEEGAKTKHKAHIDR